MTGGGSHKLLLLSRPLKAGFDWTRQTGRVGVGVTLPGSAARKGQDERLSDPKSAMLPHGAAGAFCPCLPRVVRARLWSSDARGGR